MTSIDASTPEEYLASLPPVRGEALAAVRDVIRANLPEGYEEGMQYGMISYFVPLETFPETYNKQPLSYLALASQKRYMALYLTTVYSDPETAQWFRDRYRESGKKLDMGKSCLRFRQLDDLPLAVIGEVVARTPVKDFIELYTASRASRKK